MVSLKPNTRRSSAQRARFAAFFAGCSALFGLHGCSDDEGSGDSGGAPGCPTGVEVGDDLGHPDPYGAKAAGQSRAGRITDESQIVQPAHGRQRINVGDFLLVNDKIAVAIEDKGLSDGYARFGGEILSVDLVGEDGRPLGVSRYNETLMALSIQMIDPTDISVINDGSDGQAAVVRVSGPLKAIPFLDGSLSALFPRRYDVIAAYDYVLEPGAEKLDIRLGIVNSGEDPIDFALNNVSDEMHGFFQQNTSQFVSKNRGFQKASGSLDWVGYISGPGNFAWRLPEGKQLRANLEISGFQYFTGPGFTAEACGVTWNPHVEVIAGGPEYDGLLAAIRRVDNDTSWRQISGVVSDQSGAAVADAWVHALAENGDYLSRTKTDAAGRYTIHVPSAGSPRLLPHKRGYPLGEGQPAASGAEQSLTLEPHAVIRVIATDADSSAKLPVRIQVVPSGGFPAAPEHFGVLDETNGRLHQEFAMNGEAELIVPPGEHQVYISRGFEWELLETTVELAAAETETINAVLQRSVDSTGVMCADFHIHTQLSADSNDPVELKVKSAIADGLEIPVSSEHEWVIDFAPIVEDLGMTDWAFGMPSEELTTFTWGHFGVVPLLPRPDQVNNGAVEWVGLKPPQMFANIRQLPEKPVFIINHPSGGGFGAYFSSVRLDRATGKGTNTELWSDEFDAIEVFNDSDFESNRKDSVADWFALLNHGHTFWAVGSSDSHRIRTSPVGYPRTCLNFGHDDPKALTINTVRDELAAGNATISGGLFMSVESIDGAGPGSMLSGSSEVDFTVRIQGPSFIDATTLEVIVDGETVDEQPLLPVGSGPGNDYVNVVRVNFNTNKPRSWVVFHAKSESDLAPLHPGRRAFAVSNPIFYQP